MGGFAAGAPNPVLVDWARAALASRGGAGGRARLLDIGCGAGRNALPLAEMGWRVVGLDDSAPMLSATRGRLAAGQRRLPVALVAAKMEPLPFPDATFDAVVAHGVWNLATSGTMFRSSVAEAARVARPGAGLFLFTFSRSTLPRQATPVPSESYVFTQFNGDPCVFLTEPELVDELARAGWQREGTGPLTEYNRPGPLSTGVAPRPALYEGTFVRR